MQHPYRIQIEDGRLAAYSSGANPSKPVTFLQTDLTRAEFTRLLATACLDPGEAPEVGGYTFVKRDHEIALRRKSQTVFNLPWATVAEALAEQIDA